MALTQMCTPRGGIESDVTVALARARPLLRRLGGRDRDARPRLDRAPRSPDDGSVRLENVTAALRRAHARRARARASSCSASSRDDFSREAFPFFRARHVEIGRARVLALRVSYVGELGCELHHPIEDAARRSTTCSSRPASDLGLVDFGYRALDSMRLEKCYRLWGADMSADWTPLEAGLERFVAFDKGDFIGRDALAPRARAGLDARRSRASSSRPTASTRTATSPSTRAAARRSPTSPSGGYGHTIERVDRARLPAGRACRSRARELTVDILGESRPAVVATQPIYDPQNLRLLS